jgi:hypothetical protein
LGGRKTAAEFKRSESSQFTPMTSFTTLELCRIGGASIDLSWQMWTSAA